MLTTPFRKQLLTKIVKKVKTENGKLKSEKWKVKTERWKMKTEKLIPDCTTDIPCAQFVVRAGQVRRSAQKTAKGCTKTYCPLLVIWVSGSRCPAITAKICCQKCAVVLHRAKKQRRIVQNVQPPLGFKGCDANAYFSQQITLPLLAPHKPSPRSTQPQTRELR